MEIIQKENVNVPNSLIVSGLTHTKIDEELFDYLKGHGSIARLIHIGKTESEYYQQVIVEYNFDTAIKSIEPLLPLDYASTSDPEVNYLVKALSSVYAGKAGGEATRSYLEELQSVATLSGRSLTAVLKDELAKVNESIVQAAQSETLEGVWGTSKDEPASNVDSTHQFTPIMSPQPTSSVKKSPVTATFTSFPLNNATQTKPVPTNACCLVDATVNAHWETGDSAACAFLLFSTCEYNLY
ncbi:zinc finger CCHC domain-containing protein 18-like [Astyanax mexicanus]|uniref:Zinc finger CCHC domain-containing protein 18-like n=1 Tax=Astyanax mexicanus TaxID=7994 RepID=A0A8T2M1M5_ASTMX|nr:zinc finger CCHC domain-containing protein 18-like [Astyanax mexicanus]